MYSRNTDKRSPSLSLSAMATNVLLLYCDVLHSSHVPYTIVRRTTLYASCLRDGSKLSSQTRIIKISRAT